MSKLVSIIVILFCFSTFSQTTITGDISGMTFKPSGNPWIVKENVFIENGSKTVIKPGCIFLFKPFSGIIIQGSLEVDGQKELPVVFTSINDSSYNEASTRKPEPFDWNGITIEKTAESVKMTNFILSYSVFGIKSRRDDIKLEYGIFRQNGQFHFTMNEKIQEIESNLPFSYNIVEKPQKILKNNSKRWAKPTGIISIMAGTASLAVMGYFLYSADDNNKKYDKSDNGADIHSYRVKRDRAVNTAIITGIAGGILLPIGASLLIWEHTSEKGHKTVSACPVFGEVNGLAVVFKF